ncbi:MAG: hypothetical protein IBJ16_03390 [Chitinophagaceae bacterium]|nr:hypothetical protein [Chitinophagaceae bacterium]
MKKIMLLCTLALMLATAFTTDKSKPTAENMKQLLENLNGTYKDQKAVDWGQGTFGRRVFTFNKGKWTLSFVLSLDPDMKNQIFIFRTEGDYRVLDPSAKVPNAYNALFIEKKKFVTLKTADTKLAQAFGLSACGFIQNQEKDISQTGCSLWKSVTECNEDHDLLSLDKEGKLYFGLRPPDNNMCSADKRPTQLYSPVEKQ